MTSPIRVQRSAGFRVVPLTVRESNALVENWHRHHSPVRGHRFSLGLIGPDGELHGAATVGRPPARMTDYKLVAEVTRLVTDGTFNACSFLYAASARVCKEMGFERIQTFILDEELGTSLKAAGWIEGHTTSGGAWARDFADRFERLDENIQAKRQYYKVLRLPR